MPRLRPFNDLRSPKQRKVTLSIFSRRLFWVLKHQNRPKNDEVSNFWPFLAVNLRKTDFYPFSDPSWHFLVHFLEYHYVLIQNSCLLEYFKHKKIMVGQCLDLPLFLQKFVIFGGKSAWWGIKKWSDQKNFFFPIPNFL